MAELKDIDEASAADVGTVVRDRQGDVFEKVQEGGWYQSGAVGVWSANWIAYPARVLAETSEPDTSEAAVRQLTPCGAIVCTGCRVCGCPALGITPEPDDLQEPR